MNTMTPLLLCLVVHKAVEGSVVLSKTSVKRNRRGESERGKVVGSFEVIFFVFVKYGQKYEDALASRILVVASVSLGFFLLPPQTQLIITVLWAVSC